MRNLDRKQSPGIVWSLLLSIPFGWLIIKEPYSIDPIEEHAIFSWLMASIWSLLDLLFLAYLGYLGIALYSNLRELIREPRQPQKTRFPYVMFVPLLIGGCVMLFGINMALSKANEISQALLSGHASLYVTASRLRPHGSHEIVTRVENLASFVEFLTIKTMITLFWCLLAEAGFWILIAAFRLWKFSSRISGT